MEHVVVWAGAVVQRERVRAVDGRLVTGVSSFFRLYFENRTRALYLRGVVFVFSFSD